MSLGVRSLLFAALGSCAVLPVALLGLNQAERWARSELEASDRQATAAARSAADQLSVAMLGYAQAAESFAAQLAARGDLSADVIASSLAAHTLHHPEFLGAYVANARGDALVYHRPISGFSFGGGTNYADRAYFQEVLRTRKLVISEAQIGRYTHTLTVQVVAPVLDAHGEVSAVTCSSVDLGAITDQAKQTVRGMSKGRVVVVDGGGRRIADSDPGPHVELESVSSVPLFGAVAAGASQLRSGGDDHGHLVRGAAVALKAPVSDWRVVATTDQSTLDAQARSVQRETAAIAAAVMLAALTLSAWLAAWLARPLRALASAADDVTHGRPATLPTVRANSPRELAQLISALGSMLESLRGHADKLEREVAARTRELSQANSDLSSALARIQKNEQAMRDDIDNARLFQERMLPRLPISENFEIAVHYRPLERVSGDIYDVSELEPGTLRIFLADATGHGVQASMRTILLKAAYDRLKSRQRSPSDLLTALNEYLIREFPDGNLHCTACCLDVHIRQDGAEIAYANAGNPPLLVLSSERAAREEYAEGALLGVDRVRWPEPSRFQLARSEQLLICSDGLAEQWDAQRQRFESQLQTLQLEPNDDPATLSERLSHSFDRFRSDRAISDDVTWLVLRVTRRLRSLRPVAESVRAPAAATRTSG